MPQTPWFQRKFSFDYDQNFMPALIERLAGTPIRLETKFQKIKLSQLTLKPDGKWSILEHLGHLSDLEPIWQGRLQDILNGEEFLREADLSNTKTHEAGHNLCSSDKLIIRFTKLRNDTVSALQLLSEEQVFLSARHPRLKTSMNSLALFTFVADHDDHHLSFM